MFELSKNNFSAIAEQGYEHQVTLPGTEKPTDWFITLRGEESKVVRQFKRDTFNANRQKESVANRQGKVYEASLAELEEFGINNAVKRIITWTGLSIDGQEIPFTPEKAAEILREHGWVRDQIVETSANIFNFQPNGN